MPLLYYLMGNRGKKNEEEDQKHASLAADLRPRRTPAGPPASIVYRIFGSPIAGRKLGNGPGVGMSGAGTQMNFMGGPSPET